jgi:hypothetical protein
MKTSISKLVVASCTAVVLASFVMAPIAEAQRRGGGGGGGGAAARTGGAGSGSARQGAQVNNSRADVRTNDVRSTSVNNVNVERNVNVNVECSGRCGGWDHPVAATAVVAGTVAATAAVVGSMVATVPPNCVPVNYGGMVYQQCGGTWYAPQGTQYVVVNPPY